MTTPERIRFNCPYCSKQLHVAATNAGKRGRCTRPTCGKLITIPTPEDEVFEQSRSNATESDAARDEATGSTEREVERPRRNRWPLIAVGVVLILTVGVGTIIARRSPEKAEPVASTDANSGRKDAPKATEPDGKDTKPITGPALVTPKAKESEPPKQPQAGADEIKATKLVGNWESTNVPGAVKQTLEFTADGTMRSSEYSEYAGRRLNSWGSYTLEGNKLKTAQRGATEMVTITKLTNNELEYEYKDGKKVAFARVAPESPEEIERKVTSLLAELDSPDVAVRKKTIGALAGYGPKSAVAVERLILVWRKCDGPKITNQNRKRDRDDSVQLDAKLALTEIGQPAVKPLIRVVYGPEASDTLAAVFLLGLIGPDAVEAVDALKYVLENGVPLYGGRDSAAKALGEIGPGAKDAKDALLKALKDPDEEVRTAATKALQKIDPK